MLYHIRFLTPTGEALGTVPFRSADDDGAKAVGEPHIADGPIEIWSEDVRAAHRLYVSEILDEGLSKRMIWVREKGAQPQRASGDGGRSVCLQAKL